MKYFLLLLLLPCFHASYSQVIINEIMADPSPSAGLPDAEFVELFNPGMTPVNLNGWTFFDGSVRILPNKTIPPNGYMIVCALSDSMLFYPLGNIAPVSSISLTNTGDKVSLRNAIGVAVDSVTYSDSWYCDPNKSEGGYTLERIDASLLCLLPSNWRASVAPMGGTPGSVNSVVGNVMDDLPPSLLYAFCPDSNSITLVFDEPIELGSIANTSSVVLPNPFTWVAPISTNETGTRISISVTPSIPEANVFIARLYGVKDCAGNAIPSFIETPFGRKDPVCKGDVIINELLFDPTEDGFDFVELYNNGRHVLALSELALAGVSVATGNPGDAYPMVLEERFIYPGEYLVLSENTVAVSKAYPSTFPFCFQTSENLPAMNVDEGMIAIMAAGNEIDRVYYHEDYHFALLIERKGVSLERIHPSMLSMDQNSWHSASVDKGGASPGYENTQYVSMIKQDDWVSVYPEIFSPDQDGYHDFVQFQINTGIAGSINNMTILNSSGQVTYAYSKGRMSAGSEVLIWDGLNDRGELADPGIYIALFELFNLHGVQRKEKRVFVLAKRVD